MSNKPAHDQSEPAERVATSAVALENSADRQLESAIRRTQLAANRTVLAAERSYAAWIRTALAAIAFGVGAKALLEEYVASWLASVTGTVLIIFGIGCLIAGMWRGLRPAAQPPEASTRRIPAMVQVVVNGLLLLMALGALIGMWVLPF